MIIAVASGKGGTGKTTVAVNLAVSVRNVRFFDCDVEEPNAHLFLKPFLREKRNAFIPVPEWDEEKCNLCGRCAEVCVYKAIAVLPSSADKKGRVLFFPHLCHGCGACSLLCPQKAINEVKKEIGAIEIGNSGDIGFVHGRLKVGEILSPALIRQVKEYIRPVKKGETVIIDVPPGTSCPFIASVKGSDFCILVAEPTPFGFSDLKLTVEVCRKLSVSFGVVINRHNIGDSQVEEYCSSYNIPILMKIPFSREIAALYSAGLPFVDTISEFRNQFNSLHTAVLKKEYETNYNN